MIDQKAFDENLVLHCPRGHRWSLVMAADLKFALQNWTMTVDQRMQALKALDSMINMHITSEVMSTIEPASPEMREMIREARKLGPHKALDVFADKFEAFIRVHPSILEALRKQPYAVHHYEGVQQRECQA